MFTAPGLTRMCACGSAGTSPPQLTHQKQINDRYRPSPELECRARVILFKQCEKKEHSCSLPLIETTLYKRAKGKRSFVVGALPAQLLLVRSAGDARAEVAGLQSICDWIIDADVSIVKKTICRHIHSSIESDERNTGVCRSRLESIAAILSKMLLGLANKTGSRLFPVSSPQVHSDALVQGKSLAFRNTISPMPRSTKNDSPSAPRC